MATHPVTGVTVWFNHAHLFHPSTLPAEVVDIMIAEYGFDGLPRNIVYGDGEPIEDEVITLIKRVYDEAGLRFPWQREDVLIVDDPLGGDRRVPVAMSDLYTAEASC